MDRQKICDILEEAHGVVSSIDFHDENFGFGNDSAQEPEKILPSKVESGSVPTVTPVAKEEASLKKRRTWKKPEDKPRRPLSAYNLFFQCERERIVRGEESRLTTPEELMAVVAAHRAKREKRRHRKSHGKISFGDLARKIASAWKQLEPKDRVVFDECAAGEKERYKQDLAEWSKKRARKPINEDCYPQEYFGGAFPPYTTSADLPNQQQSRVHSPVRTNLPGGIPAPVTPQEYYPEKRVVKMPSPQGEQANGPSLQSLISRGKCLKRYQALLELQIESEIQQKKLMQEAQQLYLDYSSNQGLPFHQANRYGMMQYNNMMQSASQGNYNVVADQTLNMAQTTLPDSSSSGGMPNGHMPTVQPRYRSLPQCRNDVTYFQQVRDGPTFSEQGTQKPVGFETIPDDLAMEPHSGLCSPSFEKEELVLDLADTFE